MDPDPDFSSEYEAPLDPAASVPSLHLPFALLCAALAVLLLSQTVSVFKQQSTLQQNKSQFADALIKRKALVDQSTAVQAKLEALILDLIALAKTDEDAKAIIAKNRIQQNAKAPAAEEPLGK